MRDELNECGRYREMEKEDVGDIAASDETGEMGKRQF